MTNVAPDAGSEAKHQMWLLPRRGSCSLMGGFILIQWTASGCVPSLWRRECRRRYAAAGPSGAEAPPPIGRDGLHRTIDMMDEGFTSSFRPLSSNYSSYHPWTSYPLFHRISPLSCASARQRRGGKGRSWRTRFYIFWLNCNEFTPYQAAASSRLPCARPRRPDAPASLQRTSAQTLFFKEGAVFRDLLPVPADLRIISHQRGSYLPKARR